MAQSFENGKQWGRDQKSNDKMLIGEYKSREICPATVHITIHSHDQWKGEYVLDG